MVRNVYQGFERNGFEINLYDLCVVNKMINGKQCTVCFYVDDNKILHMNKHVINDVIKEHEKHLGKMTVTSSNNFGFIGMSIIIDIKTKCLVSR